MNWLKRWFAWPSWFAGTVGGHGSRHARRNFPTDNDCREFPEPSSDLERIARALALAAKEESFPARHTATTGVRADGPLATSAVPQGMADGKDIRESQPSSARGDFDDVATLLDRLLSNQQREHPLARDEVVAIAHILLAVARHLKSTAENNDKPSKLSFYESEMIGVDEKQISELRGRWEQRKNALEARAKHAKHALSEGFSEYTALEVRHSAKNFRQPQRLLPMGAYRVVMIMLGIVEYPLNAVAFRILREKDWMTYGLALMPAIIIPLLAHLVGTKIKQWPARPLTRYVVMTGLGVGALLVGLAGIAVLRAEFLTRDGRAVDTVQGMALLAINLLALSAGIVAAYAAHDEDAELEGICSVKASVRKKLDRLWKEWNVAASLCDADRGSTIEQVNAIRDNTRAKIDEYRLYNSLYRDDKSKIPASFKSEVTNRLFEPRDFGPEIDPPPLALDEALNRIVHDMKQHSTGAAVPSTPKA